jgi:hypothetical protein
MLGPNGAAGKDGKDGIHGPEGGLGKPGKPGDQGDAGDHIKSELKVHLNALKSYVDMKFDVLKSMMNKAGGAKGKKPSELGEGKSVASQIEEAHAQLKKTLEDFENV